MKRKFANRPTWARVLQRRYTQTYLKDKHFEGDISILCLDKVREPLNVKYENIEVCIAADGFSWMQHFPIDDHYSITTTFDHKGEVVQFYFDIVKAIGRTEEGVPYLDDLFLDVVFMPGMQPFLLDEEELDEALNQNVINETEYNLAILEANKIVRSIETGTNMLIKKTEIYFKRMNQCLQKAGKRKAISHLT